MKSEQLNKMYCRIYRLRQKSNISINTRQRTIFYEYGKDEKVMKHPSIQILCKEFGFVRQATFA